MAPKGMRVVEAAFANKIRIEAVDDHGEIVELVICKVLSHTYENYVPDNDEDNPVNVIISDAVLCKPFSRDCRQCSFAIEPSSGV